jgi:prepilin-type processing-associated H-X9-DG protein
MVQADPLPPELNFVPRNAAGFVSIRGELWQNDMLKPLRDYLTRQDPAMLKRLQMRTGFTPEEVERVTLLFPTDSLDSPPLIFVTLKKPYDQAKLLSNVKATTNRTWISVTKPVPAFTVPTTKSTRAYPDKVPLYPKGFPPETFPLTPPKKPFPTEPLKEPPPAPPAPPKVVSDEDPAPVAPNPEDLEFDAFHPEKPALNAPYYYLGPTGNILVCFDSKTLLFLPGNEREIGQTMLNLLPTLIHPGKTGPLDDALVLAANHAVVSGWNVAAFSNLDATPEPVRNLLAGAKSLALTADLTAELSVSLRIGYADNDAAAAGKKSAGALMERLKEQAVGIRKNSDKSAPGPRVLAALMDPWEALLAQATCSQKEATVEVSASIKADAAMKKVLENALKELRVSRERLLGQNNLKQIGLAVLSYESAFRQLPFPGFDAMGPATAATKKPTLSWRVAILPYLGEARLYSQFKLDEPWDSEHNKKLIPLMPKVYAPINGVKAPVGQTFYQILQGEAAMRPGMRITDFTDGTSNTIMVIESEDSVTWTQPEDLLYHPKKPLPKLGGLFGGGFNAVFVDGHVRWFPKTISEKTLRALITPDGGEVVSDE